VSNSKPGLYTANLSSGALSLIGNFATGVTLVGVTEAPTTSFAVAGFPSPIGPGTAGTFTVTALDPYGLVVPSYPGTVTFTSSDTAAVLPGNTTLTNGLGTFTATLNTVGTQTLTASDVAVPTINGTQGGIVVSGSVSPPPPPVPPPPPFVSGDRIGVIQPGSVVRIGTAALDSNGNGVFDSDDAEFSFGFSTDKYVAGDWNNLGFDSLGVVRATNSGVAEWVLDSNGNNMYDGGDAVDFYGLNSDSPVVGDWTGSGTTKIGVVRHGADGAAVWTLNTNGTGAYNTNDTITSYGLNSDTFITGDWNGGGKSLIGVVRPTSSGVLEWILNTTGTGTFNASDTVFFYGQNGDTPVVGDWTGNGVTKIGITRLTTSGVREWVLDTLGSGTYNPSDAVFFYGTNSAVPVVGKWHPPSPLRAADGALNAQVPPLMADGLFVSTINQAIAAWQQAGLDPQSVARLQNVHYSVGALGGDLLGLTSGNDIAIDATAAGHSWSEGPAPQPGQMDLFTALAHEMGHELGLPDQGAQPGDVMFDSLLAGVRKSPTTQDVDAVFASLGHS
jgi:hypothetical protein